MIQTRLSKKQKKYSYVHWYAFLLVSSIFTMYVLCSIQLLSTQTIDQIELIGSGANDRSILLKQGDDRISDSMRLSELDSISRKRASELIEIHNYRMERNGNDLDLSWYIPNKERPYRNLKHDADINGTILDFAVVGFPKCGTTTLMANLAKYASMPQANDVCTPAAQTLYYSWRNWAPEFGPEKPMRGSKCPAYIDGTYLRDFSDSLPRTKLIIGIRHPVLWFQSFWNMQASYGVIVNPYEKIRPCLGRSCRSGCPEGQLFCLHRSRFHLALAKLGKTELSQNERNLLAPNDSDGGDNLVNDNIRNPVFIYEQKELDEDYIWDSLADFLDIPMISHDAYEGSHGGKKTQNKRDFCDDEYDNFRALMMPYAYDLSVWLQNYFIPLGKNESRLDVVIPNPDKFYQSVEDYKEDPCGKLIRFVNGSYGILNKSFINDNLVLTAS